MTSPSKTERWVRCPTCGEPALYAPSNAARPFCSPRCRNLDLGAWSSEGYRVEAQPEPDEDPPAGATH